MTLDELRRKAKGTKDQLWWSHRYFIAVSGPYGGAKTKKDRQLAIDCFVRLANADPEWAMKPPTQHGPETHSLAMLLKGPALSATVRRLKQRDPTAEALLRGSVMDTCARWTKDEKQRQSVLLKAWKELSRVPVAARTQQWRDFALMPASVADYAVFVGLANEAYAAITDDFSRAHFLPTVIPVAFARKDWPQFEEWIRLYRTMPESLRTDHSAVAVANYEGLRALDEQRMEDAEVSMRLVLELAPATQFLSNEDVSALPKRLKKENRHLDLVAAFEALVKQLDWRILND